MLERWTNGGVGCKCLEHWVVAAVVRVEFCSIGRILAGHGEVWCGLRQYFEGKPKSMSKIGNCRFHRPSHL
jgi:hypothetical protein